MIKLETIYIISLIMLVLFFGISLKLTAEQLQIIRGDIERNNKVIEDFVYISERLEMYNQNITWKKAYNGLYFYEDNYYCVYVKGRPAEEIFNTEIHERCHALINNGGYEHFCLEYEKYIDKKEGGYWLK